ncbi:hypothetical protein GCM10010123_02060 [Pilimelia anulata]|uniref:Uncharacterized protein n=1 Tax=Pilimelia anulata TaxID=53371 RepID=A0A8J3AZS0_9ACTN|nr:hypothetical protein [Pilimelia anulata]GGJ75652.1 hypothetical protein GCM10010123_02060 [Pilimelia anulata]
MTLRKQAMPATPASTPVVEVWEEPARYGWTCTRCRIGTFPEWRTPEAARADADTHTCTPRPKPAVRS